MRNPCWVCTSPRSGSTFLIDVLNQTGEFEPIFKEYLFKSNKIHFFENSQIFKFCKAHAGHFKSLAISLEELERMLPNIQFVHLNRQNLVDRAVSFAIARASGKWHVIDEVTELQDNMLKDMLFTVPVSTKAYEEFDIHISDQSLLEAYTDLERNQFFWDEVFKNKESVFRIDYDEMINDKSVLEDLFKFLEIEAKPPAGKLQKLATIKNDLYEPCKRRLSRLLTGGGNIKSRLLTGGGNIKLL